LCIWHLAREREIILHGAYVRDPMSDVLKIGLLLITLFGFVYAKDYLREHGMLRGEYYVLGLFATLGMLVMISANNFLTVYLGLELLALCLYALVAFHRDSKAGAEAAMKYFVLGALASGMLLYGISMVYGATGELAFPEVASVIASGPRTRPCWCSGSCSSSSVSRSNSVPSRSTCGCRTSTMARRRRSRCSWAARPRSPRSRWRCACWSTAWATCWRSGRTC
jgi:NADH:ubiquinone oxidoreductase subunit 2 (subunit N)